MRRHERPIIAFRRRLLRLIDEQFDGKVHRPGPAGRHPDQHHGALHPYRQASPRRRAPDADGGRPRGHGPVSRSPARRRVRPADRRPRPRRGSARAEPPRPVGRPPMSPPGVPVRVSGTLSADGGRAPGGGGARDGGGARGHAGAARGPSPARRRGRSPAPVCRVAAGRPAGGGLGRPDAPLGGAHVAPHRRPVPAGPCDAGRATALLFAPRLDGRPTSWSPGGPDRSGRSSRASRRSSTPRTGVEGVCGGERGAGGRACGEEADNVSGRGEGGSRCGMGNRITERRGYAARSSSATSGTGRPWRCGRCSGDSAQTSRDLPSVMAGLGVTEPEARRVLNRLSRAGYVRRDPDRPDAAALAPHAGGRGVRRRRPSGGRCRGPGPSACCRASSAGWPRSTGPHFLCRVTAVGVFGSYVTGAPVIDELDLVVRIVPKPPAPGTADEVFRPDRRLPYWRLQKPAPAHDWPRWRERHVELYLAGREAEPCPPPVRRSAPAGAAGAARVRGTSGDAGPGRL